MNQIWSEEAGPSDAPLVVLVHGTMDRSTGMLRISRRLDDQLRVLRYDRRGYGKSSPHNGPFDMAAQVGDPLIHMGRTTKVTIESGLDRRQAQPGWAVAIGLSLGPTATSAVAVAGK